MLRVLEFKKEHCCVKPTITIVTINDSSENLYCDFSTLGPRVMMLQREVMLHKASLLY